MCPLTRNRGARLKDFSFRSESNFLSPDLFRGKPAKYCEDLVQGVLDFFVLDSDILSDLPIACNRKFRESLKKKSGADSVVMLLQELGVLISYRSEVNIRTKPGQIYEWISQTMIRFLA